MNPTRNWFGLPQGYTLDCSLNITVKIVNQPSQTALKRAGYVLNDIAKKGVHNRTA